MNRYYHEVMRIFDRMGTQEWVLVLAGLVVIGWFFLRGFGSRSSY